MIVFIIFPLPLSIFLFLENLTHNLWLRFIFNTICSIKKASLLSIAHILPLVNGDFNGLVNLVKLTIFNHQKICVSKIVPIFFSTKCAYKNKLSQYVVLKCENPKDPKIEIVYIIARGLPFVFPQENEIRFNMKIL